MRIQNKKGVSNIIGYVLLIVITMVISTIVFQWMKTYIPTDSIDCPDSVSVFVKDHNYNCIENQFNFTLKNNGRFDIAGYFIHGTNSSEQELAVIDLTSYNELNSKGIVIFDDDELNHLIPNNEINNIFDFSNNSFGQIYSIEIIPIRYQLINNKNRIVSCSNAKIKEIISCS
jgi:flagellin-like protein|tara:strand:+ start:720 stop:1238 length:519 start_codon:yes stop_codon:yes gene_type:complete